MKLTLDVGSKCAILLPQRFISPYVSPAKGLILNRLMGSKSLVLVEEVWQILGLKVGQDVPYEEVCFPEEKRIRHSAWGWQEIPELLNDPQDYLLVEVFPRSINPINDT